MRRGPHAGSVRRGAAPCPVGARLVGQAMSKIVKAALAVALTLLAAGPAAADEVHRDSHNAPVVALISTGQIDDPLEDVLEHALNFGGGRGSE